jgi:hypothetical protein
MAIMKFQNNLSSKKCFHKFTLFENSQKSTLCVRWRLIRMSKIFPAIYLNLLNIYEQK